jgi:hypothetical protein
MVIETDDPSSVLFFRFISEIQKFVELYHFRFRSASQIDLSQKNKPVRMAQVKRFRAEQLEMFRKLKGTRIERFRLIKLLRESNGEKVTLDRINAEISIAQRDERNDNILNIHKLLKEGYSIHQISTELGIPKSTISRYLKKGIPELQKEVPSPVSRVLPLRKGKT